MKRLDHLITVLIILYFQLSFLVQTTTTEVRNISYISKSLLWRLRPPTLATITCTLRALFVLKGLCLAAVAEGRDEEAWPISWLTQHLIVVAMLVKLLLFLIAASSLRVSFSISQHALCCKLYSFNFSLFFFLFSPARLQIFTNAWWRLPFQLSAYLRLFEIIRGASFLDRSWTPWKYFTSSFPKGFELWSFLQRTFHLLLMNDNKSGVIYSHL